MIRDEHMTPTHRGLLVSITYDYLLEINSSQTVCLEVFLIYYLYWNNIYIVYCVSDVIKYIKEIGDCCVNKPKNLGSHMLRLWETKKWVNLLIIFPYAFSQITNKNANCILNSWWWRYIPNLNLIFNSIFLLCSLF